MWGDPGRALTAVACRRYGELSGWKRCWSDSSPDPVGKLYRQGVAFGCIVGLTLIFIDVSAMADFDDVDDQFIVYNLV